MPIFIKNINIWAPWNFLKMKALPKIWIWTFKIIPDIWLVDLFPHSTLLHNRQTQDTGAIPLGRLVTWCNSYWLVQFLCLP